MISYAQNFEDVLLNRCFAGVANGFYVDVGACDPVLDSVTKHFYDLGWNGINIEPGSVFSRLAADRPRDINLNLAVSDHSGTVTFYEYPDYPGLSTLEEGIPVTLRSVMPSREVRTVPCSMLGEILAEHAMGKTTNFLKIDVEGHESKIVCSTDWRIFRPEVIIVEATVPTIPQPSDIGWEVMLTNGGYTFAYFDGINRFYVRSESDHLRECFTVPVNVFDSFTKYDPHVGHLERTLTRALEESDGAKLLLARAKGELATSRQETATVQDTLAHAEDQLAACRDEANNLRFSLTQAGCQLAEYRDGAVALRASLANAENGLISAREEAAVLARSLSDAQSWRRRLLDDLRLDDGPREIRAVLPLARVARRMLPRQAVSANGETADVDSREKTLETYQPKSKKRRSMARRLRKLLPVKRLKKVGRRYAMAVGRGMVTSLVAPMARHFPTLFEDLRGDLSRRLDTADISISSAVLEEAILTIALHGRMPPEETSAVLSRIAK